MKIDLPIASENHQIDRIATKLVDMFFTEKNWIYRNEKDADYGIDAELEIVGDQRQVTAMLAKLQIKGHEKPIPWKEGVYRKGGIKRSTLNHWLNCTLPVIIILVDNANKKIYWELPYYVEPEGGADTVSIYFQEQREVSSTFNQLKAFIESWSKTISRDKIFLLLPQMHRIYQSIKEQSDYGDCFLAISDEFDAKFTALYEYIDDLNLAMGRMKSLFPIQVWYGRNEFIWGDHVEGLTYGSFSEIKPYIIREYEEAFEAVKEKFLKVGPPDPTDVLAVKLNNFFASLGLTAFLQPYYKKASSVEELRKFWGDVEKVMEEVVGMKLNYRAKNARQPSP